MSDDLEVVFSEYYQTFKQPIYNYFLYRVRFDHEAAEDLTSHTFLKAYKHFGRFDHERSFKTWVFTIAHNLLVNYYRSYKQDFDINEIEMADNKPSVIDNLDIDISMKKVLACLDKFPNNHRELIILRYINGLSYTEIAKIVEKEEGTIRVAVSRIIKKLKSELG